jgi:molecular chaperone Hsp33
MAADGNGRLGDDVVQPFQIESSNLRGRLVRLGATVDEILSAHDYPEPVAQLLGETVMLAAMMASALKYEGVFTLQAKGDAAVSMLVADITSGGDVRGYAKLHDDRLPEEGPYDVPALLGRGYLAFTVDQGEYSEPYQGIVELVGSTLADCLQHYFRQSEQVDAGLKLALGRRRGRWRAGGLMVQRLPDAPDFGFRASHEEDDWRRAMVLMESCTEGELLDPELPPNDLLFRLFHHDGVRVFRPAELRKGCRCSRTRAERILQALPMDEVRDCMIEGRVVITCEFCNATYEFDELALAEMEKRQRGVH